MVLTKEKGRYEEVEEDIGEINSDGKELDLGW